MTTKRLTSARAIILETLTHDRRHWRPQEIYEAVRQKLPSICPSTVYRALEYLLRQGLVSVSDLGWDTYVYEVVDGNLHHHLVCQKCGAVFVFENDLVQEFFGKVSDAYHFVISTNHLILFGLCERCAHSVEKQTAFPKSGPQTNDRQ